MIVSRMGKSVPKPVPEPDIPDIVVRRLPIYHRTLQGFLDEGLTSVSSSDLAERIGVTAAQIRRDLSNFGKFGTQGKGYDIHYLVQHIASILRITTESSAALCGLGRLGQAVVHYRGWEDGNLCIHAVFDCE